MPRIYVEHSDPSFVEMFRNNGWIIADSPDNAEFVQFTGGADVNPKLYGGEKHYSTSFDDARDVRCVDLFNASLQEGKKLLGICRGAQFLTVMAGGELWQDVRGHAIRGTHTAVDLKTGLVVEVTSTHHQMMCSDRVEKRELVAVGTQYGTAKCKGDGVYTTSAYDEEVVWYPHINALAFQPHPEYTNKNHSCQKYYFSLIERYFGNVG